MSDNNYHVSIGKGNNHHPGNQPSETEKTIIEDIQQKGMLHAVKNYKTATGVGLKEAKDFVDSVAHKYNVKPNHKGGGCAGVLVALSILIAVMIILFSN